MANLLADYDAGIGFGPEAPGEDDVIELLHSRDIDYTTWEGWYNLDAHERSLGEAEGRERKKVRSHEEMVHYSSGEARVKA